MLLVTVVKGQDLHFTQYQMTPALLNAANTASDPDWDTRMGLVYRDQWRAVPVTYQTAHLFYDRKLSLPWLQTGELGVGGHFTYDQAGDSQLSWTQLGINVSYSRPINNVHQLAIGIGGVGGQRAFDLSRLEFGDQYNGEAFDPNQVSLEKFNRQSDAFTSWNTGLTWLVQPYGLRAKGTLGVSAFHLNRPTIEFDDGLGVALPIRYALHLDTYCEFHDDWDWTVYGHYLRQGAYQESLFRAGLRYHTQYQEQALIVAAGIGYRWSDAWLPHVEVWYDAWRFSFSYDINTSPFQTATLGRGGPEVALHYYLKQVKPPDEFKACPIF